MSNSSFLTEFLLLTFADKRELQLLHFSLFLGVYLAALLGNVLIITAVAYDHRLHTPMYFFLLNLSILDFGSISTTVPRSMASSLWNTRAISFSGCATQVFLFLFFISSEYYLLTVMAYDRYIAICRPLHYGTLMASRTCVKMAAAARGSGFLNAVLHTGNTFSIPLCQGNVVEQFFCEIPQLLRLSCSDSYFRKAGVTVAGLRGVGPVRNGAGDMVTKGMEKAKVYSAFFVSVFPDKTWLQESQVPETHGNMSSEDLLLVEGDQIGEDLNNLKLWDLMRCIHECRGS
ncbi:olfactory receptor 14C36-like [Rhea pennata]|uniref:olfactory receptor 14C36-like n=1 Tax=Rhea pennata TaxID=8795 RepID=UPI002E25CD60